MKKNTNKLLWLGAAAGAFLAFRAIKRNVQAYSFKDKVVVITGGARGLGLVLARQLADEGAKLAICSRTSEQLENAKAELELAGAQIFAHVCDITDKIQLGSFLKQVSGHFGQ